MIEIFDKHYCSFVSVTQNINTADSRGRLMLNVLLSFAQFEREISGEHIRDKILASKKEDRYLIKILANSFTYRETQEAKNLNLHELTEIYHQDSAYIGAQIRLTFLAPDIIDAILRGTQPKTMTARELLRASIPASWPEQRKLFGFPPVKD